MASIITTAAPVGAPKVQAPAKAAQAASTGGSDLKMKPDTYKGIKQAAKTGAKVGAAAGAAAGTVALLKSADAGLPAKFYAQGIAGYAGIAAVAFAAVGGLVGAAVGAIKAKRD